jgi:hypothetical protein
MLFCSTSQPNHYSVLPSGGEPTRPGLTPRAGTKIVTWLILPVVICLSQRLSHACLSISNYTVKLRMAHYISHNLFDSTFYLDNRGNSRANTCLKPRLTEGCIY